MKINKCIDCNILPTAVMVGGMWSIECRSCLSAVGEFQLKENAITTWNKLRQPEPPFNKSDGSTASYYQLPEDAKELQDLISFKDMNAQTGEIFRAVYRYGVASHSDKLRDAKKIKFYIDAEIKRLEKLQ